MIDQETFDSVGEMDARPLCGICGDPADVVIAGFTYRCARCGVDELCLGGLLSDDPTSGDRRVQDLIQAFELKDGDPRDDQALGALYDAVTDALMIMKPPVSMDQRIVDDWFEGEVVRG